MIHGMKFAISALILALVFSPVSVAVEQCSVDGTCSGSTPCGPLNYTGYSMLFSDWSELSEWESHCSIGGLPVEEEFRVYCPDACVPCEAKDYADSLHLHYALSYGSVGGCS